MKTIKYDNLTFSVEHISDNEYKLLEVMDGERSLPGIPFNRKFGISQGSWKDDEEKEYDAADAGAVVGIASSTSVDSYGTEMSLRGLETMAVQFDKGVPLTPRHNGDQGAVEWDEVIGETYKSAVERVGSVATAADGTEQGYVLRVWSKLYDTEPKAKALARRLDSKQPIGMSIGGWFVDARMVTGDDEEVERIIIDNVVLDHLAITRRPANPDSVGLDLARSLGNAISRCSVTEDAGVQPTETTSNLELTMDTENTEGTVEELLADVVELANEAVTEERTEEVVEETAEEVVEEETEELEERAEESEEAEEEVEADEADVAEIEEEEEIVEDEEPAAEIEEAPEAEEVEDEAPEADEDEAPAEERNELLDTVLELRNMIGTLNERIDALEAPVVEEEPAPVVEEIERSEPNLESQVEELKAQVEELEAQPLPKAELPTVGRSEAAPQKEEAKDLTAKVDFTEAHYNDLSSALSSLLSDGVEAGLIADNFTARK